MIFYSIKSLLIIKLISDNGLKLFGDYFVIGGDVFFNMKEKL